MRCRSPSWFKPGVGNRLRPGAIFLLRRPGGGAGKFFFQRPAAFMPSAPPGRPRSIVYIDGFNCDLMILVSGDSDLVPAVSRVRALGEKVLVYIPARDAARGAAVELRSAATKAKTLPGPAEALSLPDHHPRR
jgi:hypothetical protein